MENPQTVRDKVRIRFRKAGDLRLVSHHDLLRCFERILRRANLPFRSTQGYHPKPRIVFALSLPLGIVGCEEVAELELSAELPTEEIHARLTQQLPPGLEVLTVQRIPVRSGAQVRRVSYRLDVPVPAIPDLTSRAVALLAAPECWIERTRPHTRRIDIRPYVDAIRILPTSLEMDLLVTPTGTARPDEVLEGLGLKNLLDGGLVLQRTRMELHDESGSDPTGRDPELLETASAQSTHVARPDRPGNGHELQTLSLEGKS